jgi:hypothetical protein
MRHSILLAILLAAALGRPAPAQDEDLSLPPDRTRWLNSPPLSMEMLKGKGAVLYFFEES